MSKDERRKDGKNHVWKIGRRRGEIEGQRHGLAVRSDTERGGKKNDPLWLR